MKTNNKERIQKDSVYFNRPIGATFMGMDVEIVVLDSGGFPFVSDMRHWVPVVRRCICSARSVSDGLRSSFGMLPSFRVALFAIGEEYFIAQRKSVYVSKDGERSSKPLVGSFRIDEMCLKAVEDRRMKRDVSLYIERYAKSRTEILELTEQRHDLLVRLLEATNM